MSKNNLLRYDFSSHLNTIVTLKMEVARYSETSRQTLLDKTTI